MNCQILSDLLLRVSNLSFVLSLTQSVILHNLVCVVSVPPLSPLWDTTFSLMFEAHLLLIILNTWNRWYLAISYTAPQPWKWLPGVHFYHWWNGKDGFDDLDDKPSCTVSCFALLAAFVENSVVVSILVQILISLYLTSQNDPITLHFYNDYR